MPAANGMAKLLVSRQRGAAALGNMGGFRYCRTAITSQCSLFRVLVPPSHHPIYCTPHLAGTRSFATGSSHSILIQARRYTSSLCDVRLGKETPHQHFHHFHHRHHSCFGRLYASL